MPTLTTTAGGVLQDTLTRTVTVSAMLQLTQTKTATVAGVLRQTVPKTVGVSAQVVLRPTMTVGITGTIRRTLTKTVSVAAHHESSVITRTRLVTAQAVLRKSPVVSVAVSAELLVYTPPTILVSCDAYLLANATQCNVLISAVLVVTPGATTSAFSLFRARTNRR